MVTNQNPVGHRETGTGRSAVTWRRTAILWWSFALTGWTCLRVVMHALFAKTPRHNVDLELRRWARRLFSVIDLKIDLKGDYEAQLRPGRPTIIMCNHSSLYDIPAVFHALPGSIRMLAKKELFRVPLLGAAMRAAEMISIDRQNKARALADLRIARDKMQDGIVLWIAPEGTRSRDGELLPFKKGGFHLAIETGAVIVPIVVVGLHKVMPAKSLRMNLGLAIEIRVGKAVDVSAYTAKDRVKLMQQVRSQMLTLLES